MDNNDSSSTNTIILVIILVVLVAGAAWLVLGGREPAATPEAGVEINVPDSALNGGDGGDSGEDL